MTDLALPRPGSPEPGRRLGRWPLLGLTAAAVVAAAVLVRHAGTPAYGVPDWGIAVALGLLAAVLAGARLVWTTGRFGFAARLSAGVAVLVLGLLSIASIGLPLLALGVLVVVAAAASPRGRFAGRGRVLAGATLIGAALPVLVLLAISGPVVTCGAHEVSTQENAFMALWSTGGATSSGSMSGGSAGTTVGRASGPAYAYTYTCRGDRLERFHLRWH